MPEKVPQKIVVGMSGGVDSSMALILLKEQGWDPVGVSLKFPVWKDPANRLRENVCCSKESFRVAKDVCGRLGVPHHIYDVSREFKKEVIGYFLGRLRSVKTPNPCVMCNRFLKFPKLLAWGQARGIRHVATGHYARVRKNPRTRRFELLKAKDTEKDQTYPLSFLDQEQLGRIVLPLGEYTKSQVYEMAEGLGFEVFLKKKQSQDFCFVAGNSLDAFLEKEIGVREGEMQDENGVVLGRHRGLHFYTVGQRKGLGLGGGPYFVAGFVPSRNILKITRNEKNLFRKELNIGPCNFIGEVPKKPVRVHAKIRYRQNTSPALLRVFSRNKARLVFNKPQRAVTSGQFAVFYRGNVCLGAGEIQ